jgi:hypothetical protein
MPAGRSDRGRQPCHRHGLVTDGGRDDGSQLIYAEGAYHVLQRVPGTER